MTYLQIYLAADRLTGGDVALKAVCRDVCRRRDILREYHYASHLDHQNLEPAIGKLFQTDIYFVYPMQYAPFGDLASYLCSRTVDEVTKHVDKFSYISNIYIHYFVK